MEPWTWTMVLAFARGIVDIALVIMDAIESQGCTVEGCPDDVRALPRKRAADHGKAWADGMHKLDKLRSGIKG